MKVSNIELGGVVLIIGYIAFYADHPPEELRSALSHPVGRVLALLGVAYVLMFQSFIIGLFLGIAYVLSSKSEFEYLDPKQQKPATKKEKRAVSSIPQPVAKNALHLPSAKGKDTTFKPTAPLPPKPHLAPSVEKFSLF